MEKSIARRLLPACLACAATGAAHAQADNPFDQAMAHPLFDLFAPRTLPGESAPPIACPCP
jgi:hypothetical protein